MPLNKFIPLSPDPNITKDSDMGMAQFGHLNTIVDYLNTYVAADSLQLDGTGPLSTTLRAITDAAGNLSPLKISTTAVQVVSPLRITTDDPSDMYLDCEDGATNNRFSITRNTASQQVNLNFASNPAGSTTIVGAIRTYVDGVNLSEVMAFREDGNVGIGTTNPTARLRVISADTNGIAEFFQNGNTASPLHLTRYGGNVPINLNTSGGTSTSPVPVGDNIQMSRITTNTYNGTAFGNSARIEVLSKGIQSATNYGSVMRFLTTPENAISMNEVMSLTSDGNVQIGIGYFVAGGAKLGIKGSGSTSATTSLLVQNSSGNQLLKVDDEGSVTIGNASYNFSSPLLTLISNVGSFTMRVGGGSQLQCSANISATNLASNDYVQCIRVLVGNGTARLTATTTDWLSITDSAQTSNGSGNLSAKFGTFGTTYASIDSSAQVEIASTSKGFLPPRMTTAQKNAIATPAAGLMVYDTNLNRPCFYSGSAWVTL